MSSPSPKTEKNDQKDKKGDGQASGPRGNLGIYLLLFLLLAVFVFNFVGSPTNYGNQVAYSFFFDQLEANNIEKIHIHRGEIVTGEWKNPPANPEEEDETLEKEFNTVLPPPQLEDRALLPLLREKGVEYDQESTSVSFGTQMLVWLLIPVLFLFFFWTMMRRSGDPFSGGMMGNFIRSPARRFEADETPTTFDDVAAMENAKMELQEIVEFLKHPARFQKMGAEIPKGVLLMGAPGTGKTLLARATAGEADVPFFSINGSEFIQMFVGVGASRVRDLFKNAKENSPCILFIDEIDAVGRVRGAGVGGGHDEREQTLNQILSEMDGFQQTEAVIVLAATNRPDVLDPALLRPGRFDRHIAVQKPAKAGRVGILKVHCRKVPLDESVDLEKIAAGVIGFSGAELKNLVNEAALHATRKSKTRVDMQDFETARDRVMMGPRREEVLSDDEKRMTAYHEAGHAIIAWYLPELDNVHKVTIIPRGRALGVTQLVPDEESYNIGEKRLHSQMAMMLGGRAAEKLTFDEYSAGAEDDLKRATQMARHMVAHWGMSEVIGPVAFRQAEEHPFLGKEMHEAREFSDETAHAIDTEVKRFLLAASDRAMALLTERHEELVRLSEELLEQESLDSAEIEAVLGVAKSRVTSAV
jgi:cell division protease FtsH